LPFDFVKLIQLISEKLGAMEKNLILSVLAGHQGSPMTPALLEKLTIMSYKILICTYDFHSKK